MIYRHVFSTLLRDITLGRSKNRKNWDWRGHVSFRPLLILNWWAKT